ncbi:hypothetical protein AGR7B_pAt0292 [Agrobacterium deltaense RV3]|nr:hypothetical protein AGR7B_pAt0292 [Agrobacterium deltaense RV3]
MRWKRAAAGSKLAQLRVIQAFWLAKYFEPKIVRISLPQTDNGVVDMDFESVVGRRGCTKACAFPAFPTPWP